MKVNLDFFYKKPFVRGFERFDLKSLIRNKSNVFILVIFSVSSLLLIAGKFGGIYSDGEYVGVSKAVDFNGIYYGTTKIVVKNGCISKVDFQVIDSTGQERVAKMNGNYFTVNNITDGRGQNEGQATKAYGERLVKCQELKDVDAVDGDIRAYNLFKYSAKEALNRARR